jgi:hypothetical protein
MADVAYSCDKPDSSYGYEDDTVTCAPGESAETLAISELDYEAQEMLRSKDVHGAACSTARDFPDLEPALLIGGLLRPDVGDVDEVFLSSLSEEDRLEFALECADVFESLVPKRAGRVGM